MTLSFLILAAIAIAGTVAAMTLRNLVHCVLALTVGFIGLAAIYLQLGAQFVGFTQILVYVGAVAILAVFVIMMTRSAEPPGSVDISTGSLVGIFIAAAVFSVLAWAIVSAPQSQAQAPLPAPDATVDQIGVALIRNFALPLEIIGLLLTAALIGAGVISMEETADKQHTGKQEGQ